MRIRSRSIVIALSPGSSGSRDGNGPSKAPFRNLQMSQIFCDTLLFDIPRAVITGLSIVNWHQLYNRIGSLFNRFGKCHHMYSSQWRGTHPYCVRYRVDGQKLSCLEYSVHCYPRYTLIAPIIDRALEKAHWAGLQAVWHISMQLLLTNPKLTFWNIWYHSGVTRYHAEGTDGPRNEKQMLFYQGAPFTNMD